jgi:hypothetical protein
MVAPANLHAHWPFIKAGLERTREVCAERWLPEDVFTHLRIGKAQCYLGFDGLHCRGFFVVEGQVEQFTNEPFLAVWILYAVPTNGEHFAAVGPFMDETMAFIDGLAKQGGAKWIAMEGRKGWERYLGDLFRPTKTKFERMVDYGR